MQTSQTYHFVVTPLGTLGDFLPAAGLARELAALGHRVDLVAGYWFEPYSPAGVRFLGFGDREQRNRDLRDPRLLDASLPNVVEAMMAPSILPHHRAIEAAVAHSGDRVVVLAAMHAVGALWAARRRGLPAIGYLPAPGLLSRFYRQVHPQGEIVLRAAFRAVGLGDLPAPVHDPERRFYNDYMLTFDHVLELFPPWFDAEGYHRLPHSVSGTFPCESSQSCVSQVMAYAQAGEAPWVFFPGSSGMLALAAPQWREFVIQACAQTGRRGIVVDRGFDSAFQIVSDQVAVTSGTNMNQLLALAAGYLHHGGVGSTSQGMLFGLPQIIVPVGYDQPTNAAWVESQGMGVSCQPRELDGATLAALMQAAAALPAPPIQALSARLRMEGGTRGLAARLLDTLEAGVAAAPGDRPAVHP